MATEVSNNSSNGEDDRPRVRVNEQVKNGGKERRERGERAERKLGKGRGEANRYRALDGEEGGGRIDEDTLRTAESS